MEVITITVEDEHGDNLVGELITARDEGEGITLRTGAGDFPVDVLSVSRRTIPAPSCQHENRDTVQNGMFNHDVCLDCGWNGPRYGIDFKEE